jgi:hypothetical protein
MCDILYTINFLFSTKMRYKNKKNNMKKIFFNFVAEKAFLFYNGSYTRINNKIGERWIKRR